MSKNKSIDTCIYDMQEIHKESYVGGNMIWIPLNTDGLRQTLFIDTHPGKRIFCGEQIDTLSLKERYDTSFNYIMILFEEKCTFCITEYKLFRYNLMRNDGFSEKDQIEHRDFKIL